MKATRAEILAGPTLFYDGVCGFCSRSVQFILQHDRKGQFRFVTLQSDLAREVLSPLGANPDNLNTAILLYQGRLYTKADMGLRTGRLLGGVYGIAWLGYLFPRFMRNAFYDFIARNRYKWFGAAVSCRLPRPDERARMLA